MPKDKIEISREHYDALCHHIRHLTTKAERISKRTAKIDNLHDDLISELSRNREDLFEQIRKLERLLDEIDVYEVKDNGQERNSD